MALVTGITKTVSIPGEAESAVIKRLSHTQLREAAKARQSEGISFMREIGGELLKALQDADRDKVKRIQEEQQADINNYDRNTLLRLGVVTWSYKVPPIGIGEGGVTNGLDELDEPTAKFLAESIFEYSRPETRAEVKNESSASIIS